MKRPISTILSVSLALALLAGCDSAQATLQTKGDAYIRSNISSLSPRTATLGGAFQVSDVRWVDEDTAEVTYEDGHIQLKGQTTVAMEDGVVTATRIKLERDDGTNTSSGSSSMMSSAAFSARAQAGEGEFCGGIAAFQCAPGLTCRYDGTYPDAGGTCVRQ